jgi:Predicted methyltransferase (contains TPR repeat)
MNEKKDYHSYVFDTKERTFIGRFEEMYANEESCGYSAWHQEDMTRLQKRMSLAILIGYDFGRVVDIGCGTGAFTNLLKKENNNVTGFDISPTAITKARARFPNTRFYAVRVGEAIGMITEKADLIVMMEVLSYLEDWKEVIKNASAKTERLFISLYLPPNPIGFVKSFDELREEVRKHFDIEIDIECKTDNAVYILAKKR